MKKLCSSNELIWKKLHLESITYFITENLYTTGLAPSCQIFSVSHNEIVKTTPFLY